MMVMPMLRQFMSPHKLCLDKAHRLQETFEKVPGCYMLSVPIVREPHMHGGDEHQSIPPRNTKPRHAFKHDCNVNLTLQVNAALMATLFNGQHTC